MKSINYSLFVLFIIFNTVTSQAAGIKKWTDENGRVSYGDTPPVSANTETIKPTKRPTNTGKALPRLTISDGDDKPSSSNGDPTPSNSLEPEQAKEACDNAKKDLSVIKKSSRIQLRAADGSLRYMTKDEIKQRLDHSNDEIKKFCQ